MMYSAQESMEMISKARTDVAELYRDILGKCSLVEKVDNHECPP